MADTAVFKRQRGKHPWVRVVEMDYEPSQHRGTSETDRMGAHPQRYWGWMKLAIPSMFFFWIDLYASELDQIAPAMTETQRAKIYHGGVSEDDDSDDCN